MKNFRRIVFLLVIELFARENRHAWNSTFNYPPILLLKQGLKIGYLPPTQYNRKFMTHKLLRTTHES